MNKTIKDQKMNIKTMKKSQRETTLELENLEKRSGAIDISITTKIQEIEERFSSAVDTIENPDTTIKENAKKQKAPNLKHPGNPGHNDKTKPKDNRYRKDGRFPT